MATSGNTRTAYLVVTHPDTGAVKDVLTITQAQMAPLQQHRHLHIILIGSAVLGLVVQLPLVLQWRRFSSHGMGLI